jgi:uncharacterized membrane protein
MMMNGPHLHLIFNHIPLFASIFGSLLLLCGLLKRSSDLKKAGLLLMIIASLATIPAFYTGRASPRVVKELPGVTRPYIHEHAESAEWAFIVIGVLGALALTVWLLSLRESGAPNWSYFLCFILSLFVTVIMVRTVYLGGEIRHTEIRPDFVAPPPNPHPNPMQPNDHG